MIKRSILALAAVVATLGAVTTQAAESGPNVSKAVAKPLKAAYDALTAKNYDAALASAKEAQNTPGDKSAYDKYVINEIVGAANAKKQPPDYLATAQAYEANLDSQYMDQSQIAPRLKVLATIYYGTKEYAKAADFSQQAIKRGATDTDTYVLTAQALYLQSPPKYKDAAAMMQEVVGKQDKPDEKSLKFLWDCYLKLNDQADVNKVLEKLVTYYPKADYWENMMASLLKTDTHDEHLQLNIYRLMADVGILKRPADFTDMAQLAIYQGFPGETQNVLEQGFAKNVFTEQRDKERNQRLLDDAKKRAATDQAQLAQSEKESAAAAAGDASVALGADYLSYGMYDKAVAAIQRGISKGNLKNPEEAQLLLGEAQYKAKNREDAVKTFDKLSSSANAGYARLAKLWTLHVRGA
jgi:hypothetical protein